MALLGLAQWENPEEDQEGWKLGGSGVEGGSALDLTLFMNMAASPDTGIRNPMPPLLPEIALTLWLWSLTLLEAHILSGGGEPKGRTVRKKGKLFSNSPGLTDRARCPS